jgi:outer membrane protein assembly factor BamB/PKD repeat protein
LRIRSAATLFALIFLALVFISCGHSSRGILGFGGKGAQAPTSAAGPAYTRFDESQGIKVADGGGGSFVVFPVDGRENPIADAKRMYAASASAGAGGEITLTITNSQQQTLSDAFFYIKYDSARLSPTACAFGDGIAGRQMLTLALTDQRDVLPAGFAGIHGATVSLAAGAPVLTATFANRPFASSKRASAAPLGTDNIVRDWRITQNADKTLTYTWTERNSGDYNCDGEVSIADLAPIAVHYGDKTNDNLEPLRSRDDELGWLRFDYDQWDKLVDGNGDGSVGIDDLGKIAEHYGSKITGYNVLFNGTILVGSGGVGVPTNSRDDELDSITRYNAGNPDLLLPPIYTLTFDPGKQGSSVKRPSDIGGLDSGLQPVGDGGTTGQLTAFVIVLTQTPNRGQAPLSVDFTADVSGGVPPYSYHWSFGDGAESTEQNPTHVYATNGYYDPIFEVTDQSVPAISIPHVMPRIFVDPSIPPAPLNLSGQRGLGQVSLTWDDVPSVTGYNIYYSATPNDSAPTKANTALQPFGTPAFTVTGLINYVLPYYFKVTSVSNQGGVDYESAFSAEIAVTPGDPSQLPLDPPTGIKAYPGNERVLLDWADVTAPALIGYRVYYSYIPNDPRPQLASGLDLVTQSSFEAKFLANTQEYYFFVACVDNIWQEGARSAPVAATPDATAEVTPWPPANVQATDGTLPVRVRVTWPAVPGATAYEVCRGVSDTDPSPALLASVNAPQIEYEDRSGTKGATYWYSVKSVGPGGTGAQSVADAGSWSTEDTTPPVWDTTVGIKGVEQGDSCATVYWGSSTDGDSPPPTTYNVYWEQDTGSPIDYAAAIAAGRVYHSTPSERSYVVPGLTNGVRYRFGVRTQDSATIPNEDNNIASRVATPTASPWPKFKGNSRNTGLSAYVGPQSYNRKWLSPDLGGIPSASIGTDGSLYVGVYGPNMCALNAVDGSVKWSVPYGGTHACPAIGADGTLYIGDYEWSQTPSRIYAINPVDGSVKWTRSFGYHVDTSPAIGPEGTIYVGGWDGKVCALNPADGTVKWMYATGGAVYTSPAIGADGTVYFGSDDGKLYAFDPSDGNVIWRFALTDPIRSSPAIDVGGTIYVGCNDGNLYALNSIDGSMKWRAALHGPADTASPSIGPDGTVYMGDATTGILNALAPADGSIKWTSNLEPAATWVRPMPVIGADGTVYVGYSQLYAVNPTDGTIKWQTTGAEFSYGVVYGYPAIGSDGTVYAGGSDRSLHAFGP